MKKSYHSMVVPMKLANATLRTSGALAPAFAISCSASLPSAPPMVARPTMRLLPSQRRCYWPEERPAAVANEAKTPAVGLMSAGKNRVGKTKAAAVR